MRLIFIMLAATLAGCVTRATINAKTVVVKISPTVEIKASPLP